MKEETRKSMFDDKFSITIKFDPTPEEENAFITCSYPENMDIEDVYIFLGGILAIRQDHANEKRLIAEKEYYEQLTFFKKVMYKIGSSLK